MIFSRKSTRGFTLIELMVVILIISLITVVAIYSITRAQKRGRDTRRKADISMIQGALESHYMQNKAYPVSGATLPTDPGYCDSATSWSCDYNSTSSNSIWIDGLTVDKLGKDPSPMNGQTAGSEGPIKNSEELKHYYGYYSADTSFAPTCATLDDSCSYKSLCQSDALTYNAGEYYILSAILENDQDRDRLGATDNSQYYINCTQMYNSGVYNQNAYIKIKVF